MGKNAQRRKAVKLANTQGATAPSIHSSFLAAVSAQFMSRMRPLAIIAKVIERAQEHEELNRAIEAERLVADWNFLPDFFKDGSPAITVDLSKELYSNVGEFTWTFRMHFACPRSVGDIDPMVKKLRSRLPAIGRAVRFLACMFIDTDSRTSAMLEGILLPPSGCIHDKDASMIYFRKNNYQVQASTLHSIDKKVAFPGHIEDMVFSWREKLLFAWNDLNGVCAFEIGRALRSAKFTEIMIGGGFRAFDTELLLNRKKVPAKVWMDSETMEVVITERRSLTAIGCDFNNKSNIVKTSAPFSSLFPMSHLSMGVTEEIFAAALSLGQIPYADTPNVVDLGPVDFSAGVTA